MGVSVAATVGMAGIQMLQGMGEASAIKAQGEYQKAMADINARNADLMAERRIKKGDEDAKLYQQKINQTVGTQKASYAGQGVALDSEIAQQVQQQTYEIGHDDIQQLKNNAYLEAMGYKTEAFKTRLNSRMSLYATNAKANSKMFDTLIGSSFKAAETLSDLKLLRKKEKPKADVTAGNSYFDTSAIT